ncbi:MAG: hypothetical protein ISR78_06870 [Spirochaetia bacterium]|nr:hypothetical protein [Spirochaetia bacterium]
MVENIKKRDFICISGFGWSGSGALVDFFLDNSAFSTAGDDEIIFVWALYKLLNKTMKGKSLDVFDGEYEQLFCAKVPRKYSDKKRSQYEETFDSYFLNDEKARRKYIKFSADLLMRLRDLPRSQSVAKDTAKIVGEYFSFLYDMMQIPGKIVIFDNLFHPQQLDLLLHANFSAFSSFTVFCVDRDPRDQFYEHYQRYASGQGLWHTINNRQKLLTKIASLLLIRKLFQTYIIKLVSAHLFTAMHRKKRNQFKVNKTKLAEHQSNIKIQQISFEQLVANQDSLQEQIQHQAENIVMRQHLTGNWTVGKHFNPQTSVKNIGKYKLDRHQGVYRYLAKTLLPYQFD